MIICGNNVHNKEIVMKPNEKKYIYLCMIVCILVVALQGGYRVLVVLTPNVEVPERLYIYLLFVINDLQLLDNIQSERGRKEKEDPEYPVDPSGFQLCQFIFQVSSSPVDVQFVNALDF